MAEASFAVEDLLDRFEYSFQLEQFKDDFKYSPPTTDCKKCSRWHIAKRKDLLKFIKKYPLSDYYNSTSYYMCCYKCHFYNTVLITRSTPKNKTQHCRNSTKSGIANFCHRVGASLDDKLVFDMMVETSDDSGIDE